MIVADRRGIALAAGVLLALGGCQRSPQPGGNDLSATPAASPAPAPAPTASASPVAKAALGAYAGKYPFDKVDGVSFLDQPAVRAAVTGLIGDPAISGQLLGGDGPATPIAERAGKLVAWGCRTHDCGDHNWSVLIAPDGSGAQACYHDASSMQARSRWYLAPGKAAVRPGDCPSE